MASTPEMRSRSEQPLGTLLQLTWQIVVIIYHLILDQTGGHVQRLSELNVSKIKKTGFCMAQSAAFRSLLWATAPVSSGKWVLKR